MPETVGQQVPQRRKQGSSDERLEERNPEEDGITRNDEEHQIVDDPQPYKCGNDRSNDAEGEPPAYNELRNKTDKCCNKKVHELTQIESQVKEIESARKVFEVIRGGVSRQMNVAA